ncbi:MAG: hypothetical protein GXP13_06360 [Gammaproteobacteria bacterium]|nr:hypothetical protein [Gammaproteobacteria bacterium]
MLTKTEKQIYRLFSVCTILAVVSFIVPRFVSNPEGGFAGAASTVLVLLIMLGVSVLIALYLLAVTVKEFRNLSTAVRIAGITPGVVLTAALIGLFWFISS